MNTARWMVRNGGGFFFALVLVMVFTGTVLFCWAKASATPTRTVFIKTGGASTTSGYYAYDVAVSEVLNKIPGFNVTVFSDPGTVTRIARIYRGELDTGLASYVGAYDFWKGLGYSEGKPHPDLRAHWVFMIQALAFVVRADTGITSVEELEGKPFSCGGAGTSTETMMIEALKAAGIHPKLFVGSMADLVKAAQDKRIVGFVKSQPPRHPDAMIQTLMATRPIRVLSWPRELAERLQREKLSGFSLTEIPAGVYDEDWNKKPILTWALSVGYVTTKNMAADVAYKIVKAVCEDKTFQAKGYPGVAGLDFAKLTLEVSRIPLHAGVYKYFKEIGLEVPERLIPPEAK